MSRHRTPLQTQHRDELIKARQRTESAPGGTIGWVLQFAETDLEVLTPSEWMVLAYELASFPLFTVSRQLTETTQNTYPVLPVIPSATAWSVVAVPGEPADAGTTLPSRDEGRQLQRTVKQGIQDLLTNGWTRVTFSEMAFDVYTYSDGAELAVHTTRVHQDFAYRLICLLAEHAAHIRQCQECSRLFLAVRRDQLFCDGRCQARVASRKYRKAHAQKGRHQQKARRPSAKGRSEGRNRH